MQPPIADPRALPKNRFNGDDVRTFRVRFWPCCVATFLGVSVWALPLIWAILYPTFAVSHHTSLPFMALATGAIALVSIAVCALYNWLSPLRASAWGMAGTSFWSTPVQVAWADIVGVRFRWLAYPCAVVSTRGGSKMWIVLLLRDERRLARFVAAHTAPDHPLHQFLARRVR